LLFRLWKIHDDRRPVDALLLIWLVTPIAAFSITWTELYPHYLILIMPAAYMLLGVGAADLWNALVARGKVRQIVFAAMGLLLTVVVTLQIFLWVSLVGFLQKNNTPDGFGVPLQYFTAVRDSLLAKNPAQVVALLDGQFVGANDDASVWSVLLDDVPTVRFIDSNTDVYPAQPTALLLRGCNPSQDTRTFALRSEGEGCYRIADQALLTLPKAAFKTVEAQLMFANGVRIVGYEWLPGDTPCLYLVWSITRPATEDYSFSVHFFNGDGQEIVNADGLSWRGIYWRPGDTVVRHFCHTADQAAKQSEITGVNIGMYTFDGTNFHNIDLLDADGTPSGQTVSITFEK
jgi:hypothetical protein